MTTVTSPNAFSALNTGASTAPVATKNDAGSQDRFLKLLVTQMQNQDPLNPMDNAQVTSQMAQISTVSEDQSAGRRVHDPQHPAADAEGYVTYSNVNAVEEMVNMISASRSYQNNVEVMNTAKSLLLKTLQMGQ